MAEIKFDLAGALKEGYSEKDVVEHLKSKGHTPEEIIGFFIGQKAPKSLMRTPDSNEVLMQKAQKERIKSKNTGGARKEEGKVPLLEDVLASAEDYTRTGASAAVGGIGTILGGPLAGNAAFNFTDEALRAINKRPTGSFISGTQNPVLAAAENTAVGEIGGRLINKGAALFKEAMIPKSIVGDIADFKPTFSGYFENAPRAKKIEETGLKTYNASKKAATQELAKKEVTNFIKSETGQFGDELFINKLSGKTVPIDATVAAELDQIIDNPIQLQKTLNAGSLKLLSGQTIKGANLRQGLAAYNLNRMIANNSVPNGFGDFVLDGERLWKDFASPLNKARYDKLYGAGGTARHAEFFKNLSMATRPDGTLTHSYIDNRMKYGSIGLMGGLIGSIIGGTGLSNRSLGAAAGITSLYVLGKGSKMGLSFLLSNPETARILAAAAKGGALSMSQEAASRVLAKEMIGMKVKAITQDNQEIDGIINKDGKFEELP